MKDDSPSSPNISSELEHLLHCQKTVPPKTPAACGWCICDINMEPIIMASLPNVPHCGMGPLV